MRFSPGNAQHVGARSEQEDSFGFSDPSVRSFVAHAGMAAVVADGIGGLSNGSAASSTAVQAFLKAYASKNQVESISDALLRSIETANQAVSDLSIRASAKDKLGTTLAAVVIHDDWLYWVSAGDSRVYFCQDGRATRLTTDHVYANDLEAEVAKGRITKEQAFNDPQRDALTSYLGLETLPRVDRSVRAFPIHLGDCVLICTDGLYRSLSDEEIASGLQPDPQKTCETLVQRALSKQNATQDNITVVSLKCAPDKVPVTKRSLMPLAAAGVVALCAVLGVLWWRSAPGIRQFSVDHSSIPAGQSALLSWSVEHGTAQINPEIGHVDQKVGNKRVSPDRDTSYTLIVKNFFRSVSRTLNVKVLPIRERPVIDSFLASPNTVKRGGSVTLSWNVSGKVTEVKLNNRVVKALDSNAISHLTATSSFTLTAIGPGGPTTTTLKVPVSEDQRTIKFTATPESIPAGNSVELAWSVKEATNVKIHPDLGGAKPKAQGRRKVNPSITTTYTLTAQVAGKPATAKVKVTVVPPSAPLKISFTTDKPEIKGGDAALLQWTVPGDVRSVSIDNGVGAVQPSGRQTVTPPAKTTYTLTVVDQAGVSTAKEVTVDVLHPLSIDLFEVVNEGQTWKLRWQVTGANGAGSRIVIDPDIGPVKASSPPEGLPVAPPPKDGYIITAVGPDGTTTSKVTGLRAPPAAEQH